MHLLETTVELRSYLFHALGGGSTWAETLPWSSLGPNGWASPRPSSQGSLTLRTPGSPCLDYLGTDLAEGLSAETSLLWALIELGAGEGELSLAISLCPGHLLHTLWSS